MCFLVYGRNQTEGKQLINGKEHKFSFLSYTCTIKIDVRGPFPRISEKKEQLSREYMEKYPFYSLQFLYIKQNLHEQFNLFYKVYRTRDFDIFEIHIDKKDRLQLSVFRKEKSCQGY